MVQVFIIFLILSSQTQPPPLSVFLVEARPPPVRPHGTQHSANTLFKGLMCDRFGDFSPTLFYCLCVQPCFLLLRQVRLCRILFRGIISPAFYQYVRLHSDTFPHTFKRITHTGSMVRLPFHKGYCGEPTHHIGVSNLSRLLY